MQIRILKFWNWHREGTVLESVPDGMANVLIRRGIAEQVREADAHQPDNTDNSTNAASCDAGAGKEAVRNSPVRHDPRRSARNADRRSNKPA